MASLSAAETDALSPAAAAWDAESGVAAAPTEGLDADATHSPSPSPWACRVLTGI